MYYYLYITATFIVIGSVLSDGVIVHGPTDDRSMRPFRGDVVGRITTTIQAKRSDGFTCRLNKYLYRSTSLSASTGTYCVSSRKKGKIRSTESASAGSTIVVGHHDDLQR